MIWLNENSGEDQYLPSGGVFQKECTSEYCDGGDDGDGASSCSVNLFLSRCFRKPIIYSGTLETGFALELFTVINF